MSEFLTMTQNHTDITKPQGIRSIEAIVYNVVKTYYGNRGIPQEEEEILKKMLGIYLNAYFYEMSGIGFVQEEIEKLAISNETKQLLISLSELISEVTESNEKTPSFVIKTPEEVYKQFYHLKFLTNEIVKVLYLNSRNELIKSRDVAIGDQNSASLKPWSIFGMAFQLNSNRIIILHNHPTGKCLPSEEDIRFTRRVQECAEILAVQLIDHIIIGENFYSFRYNDLL